MILMLKEVASSTFDIIYLVTKDRKQISFLLNFATPPHEAKIRIFPNLRPREPCGVTSEGDL